ncbi:uncharacterized protein LOC126792201 [Argentina anserina]|uniref:uncharacterized protein LOC126792201 n=1 Tax=Argentina anserina TaxID=57926 RepID=UPI0021766BDD|nr:uncharacterized protein LOC126792201 [Potentilla anserina]
MSDHPKPKRFKNMFAFYKKDVDNQTSTPVASETPMPCSDCHSSLPIKEIETPSEHDTNVPPTVTNVPIESPIQADPGLREMIYSLPVNHQDHIRRQYILMGPCQPKLQNYPQTFDGRNNRRFQYRWFTLFPWMEYSEAKDIAKVVLDNAPKHAMYIAPSIQKEILDIIATKIRSRIRAEIGDAKFCILVDESLDVSHKEQMAIIIRFVDEDGFLQERFLEIVTVEDTTSANLKKHICIVLSRNNLQVENIRGQGYDGASNMRGQFHGLKTLFLEDCPYAYYVHCFAHRLQLALNACARDLKDIQEAEIAESLADGNLETGKGLNQIHSLKRACMTRWGSHFASISTLVHVFEEITQLLQSMMNDKDLLGSVRGDAKGYLKALRAFDFVFCLLLTNKVMGITDLLSQALQKQSQDIVNAMNLVSSTKALLQALRDDGWNSFFQSVLRFGENHGLEMPNMDAAYSMGTGRGCQQHNVVTNEHYYHFDMFNMIIDVQMMELNDRFTEETIELLIWSSALDPKNQFKNFDMEKICKLAEMFYPEDFDASEVIALRLQLEHYKYQVVFDKDFQKLSSLAQLCRRLVETDLAQLFPLVDRLIRLVLTLPVSTATTERAFSAMKIIKTRLRNKMEDGYLSGCMMLHIEKQYVDTIDSDEVIDHFESIGDHRAQFRYSILYL